MVNKMLLEHVAPSFDDVQQSLFERFRIHAEPRVKDLYPVDFVHFGIKFFVSVNLKTKENKDLFKAAVKLWRIFLTRCAVCCCRFFLTNISATNC